MIIAAAALVALLAAWVVLALTAKPGPDVQAPEESDAEEEKRSALRHLLDLELDHATGKISDPEYAGMRRRGEAEAIIAIKRAGAESSAQDEDDLLESEIAAARSRLKGL